MNQIASVPTNYLSGPYPPGLGKIQTTEIKKKNIYQVHNLPYGLPWWLSGKESAYNAGDTRDTSMIPGLRRSPGEGNGYPLQYSCLGNPMDRGMWQVTVHEVTEEADTTQ